MILGIAGVTYLLRSGAQVEAEEARLRDEGVTATATLKDLGRSKIGSEYHTKVRATWMYDGESHAAEFTCDDCLDDNEYLIWVDPADPGNWLAESGASAMRETASGFDIAMYMSPVVPVLAIIAAVRWRQWLPSHKVRE